MTDKSVHQKSNHHPDDPVDSDWFATVGRFATEHPPYDPDQKPDVVAPAGGDPNYAETYDKLYLEPMRQQEATAKAAPKTGVKITYTDDQGRHCVDPERTIPIEAAPAEPVHVRTEITEVPDGGVIIRVFFRHCGRDCFASFCHPGGSADTVSAGAADGNDDNSHKDTHSNSDAEAAD
jgi:hypothetical protein